MTLSEIRARHSKVIREPAPFIEQECCAVCCDEHGTPIVWPCDTVRVVEEVKNREDVLRVSQGQLAKVIAEKQVLEAEAAADTKAQVLQDQVHVLQAKLATLEAAVGQLPKLKGEFVVRGDSDNGYEVWWGKTLICDVLSLDIANALADLLKLRQRMKGDQYETKG